MRVDDQWTIWYCKTTTDDAGDIRFVWHPSPYNPDRLEDCLLIVQMLQEDHRIPCTHYQVRNVYDEDFVVDIYRQNVEAERWPSPFQKALSLRKDNGYSIIPAYLLDPNEELL